MSGNNQVTPLPEELRLAYLDAMAITAWVPKTIAQPDFDNGHIGDGVDKESIIAEHNQPMTPNDSAIEEVSPKPKPTHLDDGGSSQADSNSTERLTGPITQHANQHPSSNASEVKIDSSAEYDDTSNLSQQVYKSEKVYHAQETGHAQGAGTFPNIEQSQESSETAAKPFNEQEQASQPERSITSDPAVVTEQQNKRLSFSTQHYIKMVNWQHYPESGEQDGNLLIICRHQVDQPAGSFAKPNSPSQFMLDYINALLHFLHRSSFNLSISLGHLSKAGLSNDSVKMSEMLNNKKPDLVLVLGDETVCQLANQETSVAQLRGQVIPFQDFGKALVSYHPYSLIETPALKSLALDDLFQVTQYFINSHKK